LVAPFWASRGASGLNAPLSRVHRRDRLAGAGKVIRSRPGRWNCTPDGRRQIWYTRRRKGAKRNKISASPRLRVNHPSLRLRAFAWTKWPFRRRP